MSGPDNPITGQYCPVIGLSPDNRTFYQPDINEKSRKPDVRFSDHYCTSLKQKQVIITLSKFFNKYNFVHEKTMALDGLVDGWMEGSKSLS